MAIRKELNRNAPARLAIEDVFAAVRDALSKEAILEAGDISMTKRRKRRRKVVRTDTSTGQTVTEEEEVEDEAEATAAEECAPHVPLPPETVNIKT